ncbi:MAG TPA: hypothetical protein VII42_15730, partial [Caulobacteraceae bacterium]
MSDHDATPDPIDKAYVQAEALLSDEEARTARRARVLAAVASEAAAAPAVRRPAWRRGGWLAAASVAGLGVLIATHIYTPPRRETQTTPAPAPAATAGPGATSAAPTQSSAPTPAAAPPS